MARMDWEKANKLQGKAKAPYKPKAKVMQSKYKGYCADCHFTIWIGEKIKYDGQAHHMDCAKAIKDETPRVIHPHWEKLLGKINQKRLKEKLGAMGQASPA